MGRLRVSASLLAVVLAVALGPLTMRPEEPALLPEGGGAVQG